MSKQTGKRTKNQIQKAVFNTYFNSLVITTDYDIRIYNCYTAKLEKCYVDSRILGNESNNIQAYAEGALFRKYYISDNKGTIECFNMVNGEKLKLVNDAADDSEYLKRYSEVLNLKQHDGSLLVRSEDIISCMTYLHSENRLLVGTASSIIKIYDESNADSSSLHGVFLPCLPCRF